MRSTNPPALTVGVALAALALAGCEQEQTATPQAPPPATAPYAPTPVTPPTTTPAGGAASAADRVGSELQSAGNRMTGEARSALDRATAGARDTAEQVRSGAATSPAQTQAAAAAQMTSDEARKLLDQAMTYVKENKYDLAEKTLNQVEANKAMLPKALQDQLGAARTALNTAKAGGGLQIPGFGAGNAGK